MTRGNGAGTPPSEAYLVTESYRSYVVRVRRRDDSPDSLRADIEDIIGGRRTALSGPAARELAEGLAAALADAPEPDRPALGLDEGHQPPGA